MGKEGVASWGWGWGSGGLGFERAAALWASVRSLDGEMEFQTEYSEKFSFRVEKEFRREENVSTEELSKSNGRDAVRGRSDGWQ